MKTPVALVVSSLILLAPACTFGGDRYDLEGGRESALVSAGLAGGVLAWHLAANLEPLDAAAVAGLDSSRVPALDRMALNRWSPACARASDILFLGMQLAPFALLAETDQGVSGGEVVAMYGEALFLEKVVVASLKAGFGRMRPFAYGSDPRVPGERRLMRNARRSFPSGHTSGAFVGAMFLSEIFARTHPDDASRHWVRGTALSLALSTGVLRIRAGHHFPSDVVAGAVIGSLVGWAIPRLHEVDAEERAGGASRSPTPGFVLGFTF